MYNCISLIFIVAVFFYIFTVIHKRKNKKYMKIFERYKLDAPCLPFLGQSYYFLGTGSEGRMSVIKNVSEAAYKKNGLIAFWMGPKLYLVVSDPVTAEMVLKNHLEKDDLVRYCRTVTGKGSVFAPVHIWRPRRKFLAPTFSLKNLNQFVNIFDQQSRVMMERLNEIKHNTFSIWKYFTTFSMDSICETTLGVKVNAQMEPGSLPFLVAFDDVTRLGAARLVRPWLYSNTLYRLLPDWQKIRHGKDILHHFIASIIQKKKESLEISTTQETNQSQESLKTFLELLIDSSESNPGFGDQVLREETLVIVLAGTDTSAVAASFTALMLSMYPEVQEKCYEELQEVFGDVDKPVRADDLPRLKYLEAVIKETLRLYPPAPMILRKIGHDLVLPSGDTVAKGCGIMISIFGIHRNPAYWGPDADQFRPERFLDHELKHPAAFIPFSHGPRSCLGYKYAMMSLQTVLANLLRHYRLVPAAHSTKNLRLKFDIMMRHVQGYQLALEKRN